ncbi:MAG TPA: allantoinase AllB [Candidatus Limnocylindria bacterium]|nr:allantoinase AllB [Candidatus Limnocylindria bacterium]
MLAAVAPPELRLVSRRVVTPHGVVAAAVEVRDGRIAAIVPLVHAPAAPPTHDLGEAYLLPGVVDTHVHVNEPGRTEWEGFATATQAAAAGGVTTIVDMPLNSIPPTTSVAALTRKREAASGQCAVDVAFWGGVVPGNAGELEGLAAAGVAGFKCFLVPSGVDEFPPVGEAELRTAMPILARLGLPLLAHAELPQPIAAAEAALAGQDPRRYDTFLASRPEVAESEAIGLLLRLCEETGCAVHVVHLSASSAVGDLRRARERGLPVTVETCPHYLTFAAEVIPDGATMFKCAPPIRGRANRERLWDALREGVIDLVASDHSPCPPEMKQLAAGDFMRAWGGIASLQLVWPVLWTQALARGFAPVELVRWMAERPARLAGLGSRKGSIVVGHDADFMVWDNAGRHDVEAEGLFQRHPQTPYLGRTLEGTVRSTYLRGRRVFHDGRLEVVDAGNALDRTPATV